jgi:predicted nuclease with TOPRIM domain
MVTTTTDDARLDRIEHKLDELAEENKHRDQKFDKLIEDNQQRDQKFYKLFNEMIEENKQREARFDTYQKATQWVVQLAFSLIASATITVIITSVFRK